MTCCEDARDKEGWHRYRRLPLCPDAVEHSRAKSRANYAARQLRAGIVVKPMGSRTEWQAGSPILVPEVDPL